MTAPKVIAYDVMKTLAKTDCVPREELRAYVDRFDSAPYEPQDPPESWKTIPMHDDVLPGFKRLQPHFRMCALSNVPASTLEPMLRNAGLFDIHGFNDFRIVPFEWLKVYKPDPRAYLSVCIAYNVQPSEVLMVTANPKLGKHDYGDVEAAQKLGMQAQLIRNPNCPQTIIELAEMLGC